jgi:two-component system, sensor histidine kinase and response regulator
MMPWMDGFTLAENIQQIPNLHAPIVMMLSSASQVEEAEHCRCLGINTYVIKPAKQSELLDSIKSALGAVPVRTSTVRTGLVHHQTRHPARVLLVEDHPVNQRLASRLLEKWGHTVMLAPNGRKAVQAYAQDTFDVVLMDVQMPEMNGYEATQAIREQEQGSATHIPIIAMTAHAIKGDRELCLAAGMDDYISKPIDPEHLFQLIESYLPARPSERVSSHPIPDCSITSEAATPAPNRVDLARPEQPLLDRAALLSRVGGDSELLRELINLFFEDTPGMVETIRHAIARKNASDLAKAAHRLKGALGNFSAYRTVQLAAQLEQHGRNASWEEVPQIYQSLETNLTSLNSALQLLQKEEAA